MSARPYIQSALSELQNALNDIQRQINDLQGQANNEKQRLQQDIGKLENEAHASEVAATQRQSDTEYAVFMDGAHHAHEEGDSKKARMGQLDNDVARAVDAKNQAYNGLQGLMQQLNGFMASPDI